MGGQNLSKNNRTPKRYSGFFKYVKRKRYSQFPFLWEAIPYKNGFNRKEKFWKLNKSLRIESNGQELFLEREKIPICPFSHQEITRALIDEHPNHIAQTGFCVYCGRLKERDYDEARK